jgi:hypothetical protein
VLDIFYCPCAAMMLVPRFRSRATRRGQCSARGFDECRKQGRSGIPAFAGMTGRGATRRQGRALAFAGERVGRLAPAFAGERGLGPGIRRGTGSRIGGGFVLAERERG